MHHLYSALSVVGMTLIGAGSVMGQAHNPVPTRVKVEGYGSASGNPQPVDLRIDIDASGGRPASLRVSNGTEHELAALILGTSATEVSLIHDSVLLVMPSVVVPGIFDSQGSFGVPIDIADPSLIGQPFYAQGLQVSVTGNVPIDVFQLSAGLKTTFHPGNEQPPLLHYEGPPLTATLLAKGEPIKDPMHEVRTLVTVPTTGWELALSGTSTESGVTSIYLILTAPNPSEVVMPILEARSLLVDLGLSAAPQIHVLIEQRVREMATPPAFRVGAVIERSF